MLFGAGFVLGYYLWGVDRKQKPDYKEYLSKTIDYIASIEKNNRGFIKQIKGLKSKVTVINKDVKDAQSRSDAQSKSLQTRIASLEKEKARVQSLLGEKARVQSLLGENQKLSKEKGQLQTKIDSLLGKNQDLAKEKEQLQTKIDQLINELDIVKQKIIEVQSPVSLSAKKKCLLNKKLNPLPTKKRFLLKKRGN
jgi:chromosome segregation ATPase